MPLDREARLIHYTGRNKHADLPSRQADRGRDVYGYASNPDRLIDDRLRVAWTLRTGLHPANVDERAISRCAPANHPLRNPRPTIALNCLPTPLLGCWAISHHYSLCFLPQPAAHARRVRVLTCATHFCYTPITP